MEFQDNPKFGVVTRAFVVLKTLYTIVVMLSRLQTNSPWENKPAPINQTLGNERCFHLLRKKKTLGAKKYNKCYHGAILDGIIHWPLAFVWRSNGQTYVLNQSNC
jgi:hypothetical protein